MRECLKCKKDISGKHESAKFCSTSCRVMYNRKNGRQNEIKPFQMQVLYNQLLDVLDKINKGQFLSSKIEAVNEPQQPLVKKSVWEELPKPKLAIKRTPVHWVELRRECENPDDYAKWLEDLEADQYLTTREKQLIKQTI